MRVAIIGRSEILYDTAIRLKNTGHEITCILTAKEAPEYTRTASDFQMLAKQWNIPFAQGVRILEYIDFLNKSGSVAGVSVNYTGIIPQEVIDIFPLGILNAHGGDLPRYRGNACQAWAILNGEDKIGLCVHRMIGEELDSGDIIARDYLPIDHTTKITKVWDWMSQRTPELFLQALNSLERNPKFVLERLSKNPAGALRCYPRRPEDGKINWALPSINVLRLINASNKPYSGAFCNFEGERLIIWEAEIVDCDEAFCAVPGQVTKIGDGFIEVACLVGKLRIFFVEFNNQVYPPTVFVQSTRKRFL